MSNELTVIEQRDVVKGVVITTIPSTDGRGSSKEIAHMLEYIPENSAERRSDIDPFLGCGGTFLKVAI